MVHEVEVRPALPVFWSSAMSSREKMEISIALPASPFDNLGVPRLAG